MIIEDARKTTKDAIDVLLSLKKELNLLEMMIFSMPEFLSSVSRHKLAPESKQTLVAAALVLLEHLYPHLPFKRARYGFDRIPFLRLLRTKVGKIGDVECAAAWHAA